MAKPVMMAVDGSSLFMRALSVLPEDKRTADDLEYMVVGMLRKAVRTAKATHMVFLCDTYDAPCWRLVHHPTYKGDRDRNGLQPRQLTPLLVPRLAARGIPVGYVSGMEADDLLRSMAQHVKPTTTLYLYTRDSDIYGALDAARPNVSLLWPSNGGALESITHADAETALGHPPQWLPAVRALVADKKDNVRGMFGEPPPARCPVNRPRAIGMLQRVGGRLEDLVYGVVDGEITDIRDSEAAWIKEHNADIMAAEYICTTRVDAMPELDPAACAVAAMNFDLPARNE